jgi:glycerol-3-phosphate acyltransferase PlsY
MQVNEALLHGWFFGNYWVRVAGALVSGFILGSVPMGAIARWLFAGVDPRTRDRDALMAGVRVLYRVAGVAVVVLCGLKIFVPTLIAAHGGGLRIGLCACCAALAGDRLAPCSRRGGRGALAAAVIGALAGLAPVY